MNTNSPALRPLLTTEEVAKHFGVSKRTIIRMVERGDLVQYRIAGCAQLVRFRPEDVEALVQLDLREAG